MTVSLMPMPKQAFYAVDSSGRYRPLIGGKVYTYVGGTSTPKATYTDSTGQTEQANPVVLDSRGEASIWLGPGAYKIILKDSDDATIWTVDGVTGSAMYTVATDIDELRATVGMFGGQIAKTLGYYDAGDNGGAEYRWDSSSTATDDGCLIIKATAASTGRWRLMFNGDIDVRWAGAKGDGTTDDTSAIAAAVATGYSVHFPKGTYITDEPIASASGGQMFYGSGAGTGQTIIKAKSTFTGTAVFILGNKSSTTVTSNMRMQNLRIDCNSVNGLRGVALYGLRDGTTLDNVYVTGNENAAGFYTNMAGDGTGSASGKMCEGVQFRNCHVQTNENMASTYFWDLNGLFESQLIGCKAFGSSGATITDSSGFILGRSSQTRGVALIGCSAANMTTSNNVGIRYAEWSRECWDQFTLLEQIKGTGVYFHGSTADGGTLCPGNCRSINARPYNNNDAGMLDPLYEFGDANGCYAGPVINYNSGKNWVNFNSPVVSQFYNAIEVYGNIDFATFIVSNAYVGGSAASSNRIFGVMGAGSALSQISWGVGGESTNQEANGYIEQHDGFYTTYNAGTPDAFRWRSNGGTLWATMTGSGLAMAIPFAVGAAWNGPAPLKMGSYYLWVDSSGRLRIKSSAPSGDTDGTIVGTQS